MITLPEYASFLNYMISNMSKMMRQLAKERKIRIDEHFNKDFNKEWSAKEKLDYHVYWANSQGSAGNQDCYQLRCLIECLLVAWPLLRDTKEL